MPELPEVETTRLGIAPHVVGRRVREAVLRRPDLRWPIAREIAQELPGQRIEAARRRAKYLLLDAETGSVIVHLGMSGNLRVLPHAAPAQAHDHADLVFEGGSLLRLHDPRRFGALLWQAAGTQHPLLADLGPEPLSEAFDADWLARARAGLEAARPT